MHIKVAFDYVVTDFLQTLNLVEVSDVLGVLSQLGHLLFGSLNILFLAALSGNFFQLSFELGELVT